MSNSGLFRLQEHTPSAYTNDSRDFQLMLRLYDCVNNGVKYYIDSIIDSLNTDLCNSELLSLLKTKVGFFSNVEFTDRESRYILKSFPYIMKYKGSERGIEQAVRVFMAAEGISASNKVFIDATTHEIEIFIESPLVETKMLEEMLKYIIPTGYLVSITFGNPNDVSSSYQEDNFGMALSMPDLYNSVVRGSEPPSSDPVVTYGFRAVSTPFSPNIAKYAYEISGFGGILDGDLQGVVFTASDNSPQLYDQTNSNYYRVEGGKWVQKDSVDNSRSCVLISGATISTTTSTDDTLSTTVLGSNTQNICLYEVVVVNEESTTYAWTNMEFNTLGDVGFTDVLGSANDDGGTPASYTF